MNQGLDHRHVVRIVAAGRVAIGVAALVAPRFVGGTWAGDGGSGRSSSVMVRALGVRDLALAYGTLRALENNSDVATWARMCAAVDGGDAIATVMARGALPPVRRDLIGLVAGGAAALQATAADKLGG